MELSFLSGIDPGPLALWASMFAGGRSLRPHLHRGSGPQEPPRPVLAGRNRQMDRPPGAGGDPGARFRRAMASAWSAMPSNSSSSASRDRRLATKVVQQFELAADTAPEERLLRLVNKMPGLQKVGQVLARNRRLAPKLRRALSELENGMSDVTAEEIRGLIEERLGKRLAEYAVELEPSVLSEASVSAVIRFTWNHPGREREQGVFKVLKPYVPECFGEDMTLLQDLGEFLTSPKRGYGFAIHDVKDMLAEVLLLLEHELDFRREQATLQEAVKMYRASIGIRVPRLIEPLCTGDITAMSAEAGVKVTEAFPRSPIRRARIADQLIEALVAVPLLFAPSRRPSFTPTPMPETCCTTRPTANW